MSATVPHVTGAGGVPLFVQDWGVGRPVVFVHAWALNAEIWEYQTTYLVERGIRCIAIDRRGHGRSPDPGTGYDYDTLADDLAAVLNALGLSGVTLVGHSMGCGEIVRYLARHGSQRVSGVALISTVGPEPQDANLVSFLNGLKHDRPGFLADGLPLFFGTCDSVSMALSQWVTNQFLRTSPLATLECMRLSLTANLRADFQALRLPTMLLHGSDDALNLLHETAERAAGLIAGSQLIVYDGAPHGVIITHRERLSQDLIGFVEQLG
jgi:non-heme chloroperoxidase